MFFRAKLAGFLGRGEEGEEETQCGRGSSRLLLLLPTWNRLDCGNWGRTNVDFKEANLFSETFHRLARVIRSRLPPMPISSLATCSRFYKRSRWIWETLQWSSSEFPNLNEIKLVFSLERKKIVPRFIRNFRYQLLRDTRFIIVRIIERSWLGRGFKREKI